MKQVFRPIVFLTLLLSLVLAACGGEPAQPTTATSATAVSSTPGSTGSGEATAEPASPTTAAATATAEEPTATVEPEVEPSAVEGRPEDATPDELVQSYFNTVAASFSDPELAKSERQEAWAEAIAQFVAPASQAQVKDEILKTLQEIGGSGKPGVSMTIKDLKLETVSEADDEVILRIVGGTMAMSAEGQSQESSLTDARLTKGLDADQVKLEKIDDLWYIVTEQK